MPWHNIHKILFVSIIPSKQIEKEPLFSPYMPLFRVVASPPLGFLSSASLPPIGRIGSGRLGGYGAVMGRFAVLISAPLSSARMLNR